MVTGTPFLLALLIRPRGGRILGLVCEQDIRIYPSTRREYLLSTYEPHQNVLHHADGTVPQKVDIPVSQQLGYSNRFLPVPVFNQSLRVKVLHDSMVSNARFQARYLSHCRLHGLSVDGETVAAWDVEEEFDAEGSGWAERVKNSIPHIDEDEMFLLHRIEWAVRSVVDKVGAKKTWEREDHI